MGSQSFKVATVEVFLLTASRFFETVLLSPTFDRCCAVVRYVESRETRLGELNMRLAEDRLGAEFSVFSS